MSKIEEIEDITKNYVLIEGFFDFVKQEDFELKYDKKNYWLSSGYADEDDIKNALLEGPHKVDKEGEWHCKILFRVEEDGDGYINWIYLEIEEKIGRAHV